MKVNQSIQALRGIAAAMVVIHHAFLSTSKYYPPEQSFDMHNKFISIGSAGVDIFFVISGYIMVLTRGDNFSQPGAASRFVRDRILRIAPLYWLFTTLAIATSLASPSLSSANISPSSIMSSLFFFPMEKYPILKVGWSLNYEIYFYLIFSLLLFASKKQAVLISIFVISASMAIRALIPEPQAGELFLPYLMTDPLLLEFAAGAAIAGLTANYHIPRQAALPLITLSLVWLIFIPLPSQSESLRIFYWGIPSIILVCAASAVAKISHPIERFTTKIGDASYAIYLSHPLTIPAVGLAWTQLGLSRLSSTLYVITSLIVCISIGILVHIHIEQKMADIIRRRTRKLPRAIA